MAQKPNDRERPSTDESKTIRPFVETVENAALEKVAALDPKHLVIDANDPSFKNHPDYCKIIQQEPTTDPPEAVRGFVASVIQAALHHVYEHQLESNEPRDAQDLAESVRLLRAENAVDPDDAVGSDVGSQTQKQHTTFMDWNTLDAVDDKMVNETGKERVHLADSITPSTLSNINWPTIGEFTVELGLKKIEEYIQGWNLNENWLHCTDILPEDDQPYAINYRYRVRWSMPTRRSPIPRATASVYFTIQVSKIKPKNFEVEVYYQVESFRTIHRPGTTRFCEQWLRDVLDNKVRLMSYVHF